MRLILAAAVSLGLAACDRVETESSPLEPVSEPDMEPSARPIERDVLTAEGFGPLRIGMTLDEVTAAMGPDSDPEAVGGPEPEACDQFRPERAPEGLLVMIEQGVLTRISIMEPSTLQTDRGLGLGSTSAEVRAAYGEAVQASPHEYEEPQAEYLDVWAGGRRSEPYVQDPAARGVRYETSPDGVVDLIHVGGPAIQYVEGCL